MTGDSDNDKTKTAHLLEIDSFIGRYKIVKKIGSGGMGDVFLAEDTELSRMIALKFLPTHLCENNEARTRFNREARAVAKLNHPNIVTIHEVSSFENRPYFVMEHVEGRTLHYYAHEEPLPLQKIIDLIIQIGQGLGDAHAGGIVHRDIKAANIVVSNRNRAKILDFGLAAVPDDDNLTKTGSTIGTTAYMSPEQVEGHPLDARSDIYSLGIVLYELLAGQTPYRRDTRVATFNAILREEAKPLSDFRNDLPANLQQIVSRVIAKEKVDRYQTANDLVAELKKIREELEKPGTIVRKQPSVAVLPFKDMSPQRDQEYFCDGIAEEIINALTSVKGLDVVARTSAFSFKGKETDIREIGNKLNVETLLEGSVRKAGDRLRITAQLIKVSDGFHLWSEKYDRTIDDIFAIQDEISLAIVDNMKLKLFGENTTDQARRHSGNLVAYQLYLKGRFFWARRTKEGFDKALDCFSQAIEADRNYALAYVGLADVYCLLCGYQILSPQESIPKARAAAETALKLNPKLAEANEAMGHVRMMYDWDWINAEKEYQTAIKLSDSYATAHHRYALLLAVFGKQEEAEISIARARELDPLSLIITASVGQTAYTGRKYKAAVEEYRTAIEMDPNFAIARFCLGLALERNGEYDESIQQFKKAMALIGNVTFIEGALGHAYATAGMKKESEEILDRLIEQSKETFVSPYSIGTIYAGLGENEKALTWLEKSCEERSTWLVHLHMSFDPRLDSLRDEPRFKALIQKMGLS